MSFSFGGIMRTINGRNLDILEKVNKELLQEDVSYKEHKCEKCGKNKNLQMHHIKKQSKNTDLIFEPKNIMENLKKSFFQ